MFEDNYISTVKNNNKNKSIDYDGNIFIENVSVDPFNDTIEIQMSVNTLLLKSRISINDLEIKYSELIMNDFSGDQENNNLDNCVDNNYN